jgi:hypothetical protein
VANELDESLSPASEPTRVPEDVLLYGALCEALLDYILSVVLGADDFSRHLIEAQFVSRAGRDKKVKALKLVMFEYCPDVADAPPYDTLATELKKLFDYRDTIAHSQPDHGDRYNRLRRRDGRNERVSVTEEGLAAELDRGIKCHSALAFIPEYVARARAATVQAVEQGTAGVSAG